MECVQVLQYVLSCVSLCDTTVRSKCIVFFFQAEDGIRDLVRSRGLGDVYKRQADGLGAEIVARRILQSLGQPFQVDQVNFSMGCSLSLIHI